jgi:hypothetical protein
MGKKSRYGSESLETIFGLKILKFFDAEPDPGSGLDLGWNIRIRDKHPGSATPFVGLVIEINRKKTQEP